MHSSAEVRLVADPDVPGGHGVPAAEPLGQYAPSEHAARHTRSRTGESGKASLLEQSGLSYYRGGTRSGVCVAEAHIDPAGQAPTQTGLSCVSMAVPPTVPGGHANG